MDHHELYKTDAERRQHGAAIAHLAERTQRTEIGIRPLYEIVLARYNRTARIRDFLTVLVSRRVRDVLRMPMDGNDPFGGKRRGSGEL